MTLSHDRSKLKGQYTDVKSWCVTSVRPSLTPHSLSFKQKSRATVPLRSGGPDFCNTSRFLFWPSLSYFDWWRQHSRLQQTIFRFAIQNLLSKSDWETAASALSHDIKGTLTQAFGWIIFSFFSTSNRSPDTCLKDKIFVRTYNFNIL